VALLMENNKAIDAAAMGAILNSFIVKILFSASLRGALFADV